MGYVLIFLRRIRLTESLLTDRLRLVLQNLKSSDPDTAASAEKELSAAIKICMDGLSIAAADESEHATNVLLKITRALRNDVIDNTSSPKLLTLRKKVCEELNAKGDMEKGTLFGEIAVERGYTTMETVVKALMIQKKELEELDHCRLIGEIMIEEEFLTREQVKTVLLILRNRVFKILEQQIAKQYI